MTKLRKKELLREALAGHAPKSFVGFLEAVVQRGRQGLLHEISMAYEEMVDVHLGHVRQKLGGERFIITVRGVGYRFEDELL